MRGEFGAFVFCLSLLALLLVLSAFCQQQPMLKVFSTREPERARQTVSGPRTTSTSRGTHSPSTGAGTDGPLTKALKSAFACLAHDDSYMRGCMVVAKSLLISGSVKESMKVVILHFPQVSKMLLNDTQKLSTKIALVQVDPIEGAKDPYLFSLAKLHVWELDEFAKVMFLDSDLMVMKDISSFFSTGELTAAYENYLILFGDTNTFSTALFVVEPSREKFKTLTSKVKTHKKYGNLDDMPFINEMFPKWNRLPQNALVTNWHLAMPGMMSLELLRSIYTLHFSGVKPWRVEAQALNNGVLKELVKFWRAVEAFDLVHATSLVQIFDSCCKF